MNKGNYSQALYDEDQEMFDFNFIKNLSLKIGIKRSAPEPNVLTANEERDSHRKSPPHIEPNGPPPPRNQSLTMPAALSRRQRRAQASITHSGNRLCRPSFSKWE